MRENKNHLRSTFRILHTLFLILPFFSISISHASDNTLLGVPIAKDASFQIVDRASFCLGYSEEHEQAAWVCYKLTKAEILNNIAKRTNNFRPDPEITTGSAQLVDYKNSGYDRGHLAPAGDMAWSNESMSDSFYLSNISPQQPGFNRGIWKNLEEKVRSWAIQNEDIFIVVGPLLTKGLPTIGTDRVSVPDFYYKVVLDYNGPEKKGIAFLLPNRPSNDSLSKYVKTIDDIELITGLDFFSNIPDLEEDLESHFEYELWDVGPALNHEPNNANNTQPSSKNINDEKQNANVYWITISSGIRHNSSCRWYKKSKGRMCSKKEGIACKLCGG